MGREVGSAGPGTETQGKWGLGAGFRLKYFWVFFLRGSITGQIVSAPNLYFGILTLSTSKGDCIWRWGVF